MATSITIVALLAAATFGGWAAFRLAALIRELTRMTSGLTGLGVQIGRLTERVERSGEDAPYRRFGAG